MRTWRYGITQLQKAMEGSTTNAADYISQISGDTDAWLASPDSTPELQDMYSIAAGNNRQVFGVVRGVLEQEKARQPVVDVDPTDVSLSPAVRGLLCVTDACK